MRTILFSYMCGFLMICFMANPLPQPGEEELKIIQREAVENMLQFFNGDVYETVEILEMSRGDISEKDNSIEFYLFASVRTKMVEKNPMDTYYMQGMCSALGIPAEEIKELQVESATEVLMNYGYGDNSEDLAEQLVRVAEDVGEYIRDYETDMNFGLHVQVSGEDYSELKVYHVLDGDEVSYKPVDSYLLPDTNMWYEQGQEAMKVIMRNCDVSLRDMNNVREEEQDREVNINQEQNHNMEIMEAEEQEKQTNGKIHGMILLVCMGSGILGLFLWLRNRSKMKK